MRAFSSCTYYDVLVESKTANPRHGLVRPPPAGTTGRSLVMGKGNKVRKKEVKKPKQDKKAAPKK
jgi:hypothetical protein